MNEKTDTPFGNSITEIERVVVDDGKCFNVKADILHRGSYLFNENGVVEVETQVPVRNDDNKLIGFASLSIEKDSVIADIYIDYSTPERLNLELGEKLWPHVGLFEARIVLLRLLPFPTEYDNIGPINA